jgi:hypothetical protein
VKDVIVTVVVAIVLAIAFMYLLLSVAFSGWGDHFPQPSTQAIGGKLVVGESSTPEVTLGGPLTDA